MRYLILLILSFTLLFSCGTDSQPAKSKAKTAMKGKRGKSTKAKKAKFAKKKSHARYWAHMKKAGINDSQIKSITSINKKYEVQINKLKKSKKWAGKANVATRKSINTRKTSEYKKVLGASYTKWTAANKSWRKASKKKS